MMVTLKDKTEIEFMRAAGQIVARAFKEIEKVIAPGLCLRDLDTMVADFIRSQGAETLYKGYRQHAHQPPFPAVITASVNDEICHGIPDERVLREGDIVGVDIGLRYQGWCGDSCVTYAVGQVDPKVSRLMEIARGATQTGIEAAQVGNRLTDIGEAIQNYAESFGYSVVRECGGHFIGRELHEGSVPHVGPGGRGPILRPGMILTVEPMINMGLPDCTLLDDGWTIVTVDGSLSAQYEHTIALTEHGPDILSCV